MKAIFLRRYKTFFYLTGLSLMGSCGQNEWAKNKDIIRMMNTPTSQSEEQQPAPEDQPVVDNTDLLFEGLEPAQIHQANPLHLNLTPKEDIDLRYFDTSVKSQGKRGWCTSFSVVAGVELHASMNAGIRSDLSEKHHWSQYKYYNTRRSLRTASKEALVPEWAWPYYGKKHSGLKNADFVTIGDYASLKNLDEIDQSLRDGRPVVVGLVTNKSWHSKTRQGVISHKGKKRGGHSVTLVGLKYDSNAPGGAYFIFKNSWGSKWGDQGYGYLPVKYCSRYRCYFISIKALNYLSDYSDQAPGEKATYKQPIGKEETPDSSS
ncbi:MAG: C1 family peptidase [Oligoflexales bacterium]